MCNYELIKSVRMRLNSLLLTILLSSFVGIKIMECNSRPKRKLQIGVKKRAENCTIKSKKGDLLHMHYEGLLENGKEFDSSYTEGLPMTFTLGSGQVIKGWDQGLMGMCAGEYRKLVIPPDLAYGKKGIPPKVPPYATLTFYLELVKIEHKQEL